MKEVQDLYMENYKTLLEKTKENLNKMKHILCSWVETPNVVIKQLFPKLIYRFNKILTKF